MRLRRMFLTASVPHWLTLLAGVLLGGVLTSTFTFHLWWCTDKVALGDLSLDRETLSIVRVNEHIRARAAGGGGGGGGEGGFSVRGVGEGEEVRGDCVCGEELRRLQTAAEQPTRFRTWDEEAEKENVVPPTYKASHVIAKPSVTTFSPVWTANSSHWNYTQFIKPSSDQQGGMKEQFLSDEFRLRKSVLVAINVPDDDLEWASQIYDSWGQDLPQIIFFISDSCNTSEPEAIGLPLVKLVTGSRGASEDYVLKTFSIIKFLHDNYIDAFHWFLLANSQTFIHGARLEETLSRLDPASKIYLGWAARGRPEDGAILQLLPHEYYCLGAPGIVLSNAALQALGRELPFCVEAIERHNKEEEEPWRIYDVELGRCLSRRVGIHCSQSTEAKAYFYQDFSPTATLTVKDLDFPPFTDLLTYYPVPTPTGHMFLHFHFMKKAFKATLENARYIEEKINSLCNSVEEESCRVYVCPCQESATSISCSSKCPTADTVMNVAKSYAPISKYDIPTWEYFDSVAIYNDETTIPGYWLTVRKDRKNELQTILNQVLQEARAQTGHRMLKFRKVINGYVRHNPSRGNEYIVDAEYTEGRTVVKARTSMVRALAKNYITLEDNADQKASINFIVPLSNVSERFQEFMQMYESCCLKQDTSLHLWLIVYGEKDVAFMKGLTDPYLEKYKRAKISIVEGHGVFSRGRALHLGMSQLHLRDLAFHCDVDMTIETSFLQRCRGNTVRGKKVYYPEFFKLYNLDYVYRGRPRPKKIPLKRQHGHWAAYSFGMLCIYKSDYDSAGGMDTSIIGWGEEDVKFYQMVLKVKTLEVFRAPDPGLTHRWHEKVCPPSLSEDQRKHCFSSRAENLADRIQLASYIYENDYQIKYPPHSTGTASVNASSQV